MEKSYRIGYKKSVSGNRLIGALGSTPEMDRQGDVVDPAGCDLANFKKNPLLLWSHDYWSLPIGKVTDVRITSAGLEFDAEFSETYDFAQQVRNLFEEGILNAFSIGFIPIERVNETITKWELLEISAVNVPANAGAVLNHSYKSFLNTLKGVSREQDQYRDLVQLVQVTNNDVKNIVKSIEDIHSSISTITKKLPTEVVTETKKKTVEKKQVVKQPVDRNAIRKQIVSNLSKSLNKIV